MFWILLLDMHQQISRNMIYLARIYQKKRVSALFQVKICVKNRSFHIGRWWPSIQILWPSIQILFLIKLGVTQGMVQIKIYTLFWRKAWWKKYFNIRWTTNFTLTPLQMKLMILKAIKDNSIWRSKLLKMKKMLKDQNLYIFNIL